MSIHPDSFSLQNLYTMIKIAEVDIKKSLIGNIIIIIATILWCKNLFNFIVMLIHKCMERKLIVKQVPRLIGIIIVLFFLTLFNLTPGKLPFPRKLHIILTIYNC